MATDDHNGPTPNPDPSSAPSNNNITDPPPTSTSTTTTATTDTTATTPTTSSPTTSKPSADGPAATTTTAAPTATMAVETPEFDDFGLPIRRYPAPKSSASSSPSKQKKKKQPEAPLPASSRDKTEEKGKQKQEQPKKDTKKVEEEKQGNGSDDVKKGLEDPTPSESETIPPSTEKDAKPKLDLDTTNEKGKPEDGKKEEEEVVERTPVHGSVALPETEKVPGTIGEGDLAKDVSKKDSAAPGHSRDNSLATGPGISEFSHQQLTKTKEREDDSDDDWQEMPAFAPYDMYDDNNKLIAREQTAEEEQEDETYAYGGLGGAGKGYTRVLLDDDAESATSMDENTQYLFNKKAGGTMITVEDDEDPQRDAVSQLQATKDLLTEGQRIAYVGLTRLELAGMVKEAEQADTTNKKKPKKEVRIAAEAMKMWSQKMMIRLYSHMDISPAEQIMVEQLSEHGVIPADLVGSLMQNARVQNPMRDEPGPTPTTIEELEKGLPEEPDKEADTVAPKDTLSPADNLSPSAVPMKGDESPAEPPPPYETHEGEELPGVRTPGQLPTTQKIDIDLRWTVLCDLFLVLIADSIYDSRSRVLLERLGKDLEIPWLDICRFEKRVTDALEMQQAAEKENWNEQEHMDNRAKMALKRRYVMMGLATVGGGLVIGLSAGLLAPVIGAGLAAGFTTIGVTGTSGFLAGTAGAAIITSGAAASGSLIGGKAASRRTGAVKTFEYRPLHNNKRVNLIVTVSGWMTGKVDDVRLPFSTVDPIMGDIYSILWEPDMLTSMGDTMNILATEALTQGLQQVLGSTILMGLMAALQLPVVLSKLSYLIDNPWAVSLDRATSAGLIMADSLIERNLGTRPVTLVGYSLGSRVIFSCLQELARKGAYGLVQNVYIFGSPIVVKKDEFLRARTVVAGRFVNAYNRNDWILGYLFRLTNGGIRRIAGLASVDEIAGVENIDVTEHVVGHMDYRAAMPRLLREVCGWLVESDEFTEIEDPDPENHQERQRELINEIEEARKELEAQGKPKSRFSIFGRKKKLEKAEWEIYDKDRAAADAAAGAAAGSGKTEDKEGNNHGVLFDVDAIRAELALEARREKTDKEKSGGVELTQDQNPRKGSGDDGGWGGGGAGAGEVEDAFQVKEIKSTLPPMRLDVGKTRSVGGRSLTPLSSAHTTRAGSPAAPSSSFDGRRSTSPYYNPPTPVAAPAASPLPQQLGTAGMSTPGLSTPGRKSPAFAYGMPERNGSGFCGGGGFGGGAGGGGWGDDGAGDGEMEMTFDTSFHDDAVKPPKPPPKDIKAPGIMVTGAGSDSGFGTGKGNQMEGFGSGDVGRARSVSPGYGTNGSGGGGFGRSGTMGSTGSMGETAGGKDTSRGTGSGSGEPKPRLAAQANPWADGGDEFDDPDFGKEKDIEMTFA